MLSSQVLVLALSASAFGLAIEKRDYSTVWSDCGTINTDTTNLKNAVNNYDGSLFKGLALNDVGNKFQNDLKKSQSDCSSSAAFTATQCTQALNWVNNPFEPNLKSALAAIKNKKATFTSNGFKSQIQSNLDGFKSATDSFLGCIKTKCPSGQQTSVQTAINKVDADFADAIKYYQS